MTNEEKIIEKRKEITEYEGVLDRYSQKSGSHRWYWMGRRKLDELNIELTVLLNEKGP